MSAADVTRWHVPPERQGQTVEIAYALRGYAGVVGISAAVAARPRVRTAPRGA